MNKTDKNFDNEAFEWLNQSELGYDIWNNKYRYNNESLNQWLDRVSAGNPKIKQLIVDKKFLFGGRTLANRGTGKEGSYSNCYSIGFVPDDFAGIFDVNSKIALTYKAQGGQGLSLSHLRPKGTLIGKSYESDGIVPFMRLYNTTTESVSQGGSRKGALMMSIDVWHKEAPTFVTIKSNLNEINKANLSIEIDDEFMQDVQQGGVVKHITKEYNKHVVEYDVDVDKIWSLICKCAHDTAEPGIMFINRFRNYNLMELVDEYQIETSNPCGEQPLPKHGACNLSSINLSAYVKNPYTEDAYFDIDTFEEDISSMVRCMDDVLTENLPNHALAEQKAMAEKYRNIGIGIMGLGTALMQVGLKYGSPRSIRFIRNIARTLFRKAIFASAELAKERGNFPGYSSLVWDSDIIKYHFSQEEIDKLRSEGKLRNCSLLSIAPTGSIGTMLGITTGMEPAFALSYKRRTVSLNKDEEKIYSVDIKEVQDYKAITGNAELPDYFVSAYDIDWHTRIAVQAALQDSCDTGISSTINLKSTTTIEEVSELYKTAWKAGLKGVTIYVDGSRDPILSTTIEKKESYHKRPKVLKGEYFPIKVKGELFAVIIGYMNDKPYEIFAIRPSIAIDGHKGEIVKKAKGMYTFRSDIVQFNNILETNINQEEKAATLYISMLLRHEIPLKYIIKTAKKSNPSIVSFTSAICRILSKFLDTEVLDEKCPVCGGKLIREAGCVKCEMGDYSRCGD